MAKPTLKASLAVNISRFLLAAVFIFSGFIKANDPRGTQFKLADYIAAFGLPEFPDFTLAVCAVLFAALEFSLGIHILFGMSRRLVSRFTLIFVFLLTLLTVYIALFNPVSDCGCFGDFIVLSNGETLAKNLVLLVAAYLNFRYNDNYIKIVGLNTRWLVTTFATVYILIYSIICIVELPLIDYRPYKIGTDLRSTTDEVPKFDIRIIYQKNGRRLTLTPEDPDPDSTWQYVETERIPLESSKSLAKANLFISDPSTGEDVTDEIIYSDGYTFLLVIPNLLKANESCVDLVNEAYEYAQDNGYSFYCLTGTTSHKALYYWRDHTGAEYQFYQSDDRELKTIVRGSPGLVLLKDGEIIGKWSSYNLPDEYDLSDRLENLPIGQSHVEESQTKFIRLLLYFLIPLLAFVIIDRIGSGFTFYRNLKRKSKKIQHIV